ncbi:MAG: hypothetical protein PHP53_11980 [Prolixibacteraceae bacterium]|nr:hypothetical protein [Prolixibacteraceae bacterium]
MKQKIFNREESYQLFVKSRKVVLEEETDLITDTSSKFGINVVETGNFHLMISTELTEEIIGLSNDKEKKRPVLLKFTREEVKSNEKYLVFSGIDGMLEVSISLEIYLVKTVIMRFLINLAASRRDNFSVLNFMKVRGLDFLEYLE